jgi:hypothetical protein
LLRFYRHLITLGYSDTPNYSLLAGVFEEIYANLSIDGFNEKSSMSIDKSGYSQSKTEDVSMMRSATAVEHRETTTLNDAHLDYETLEQFSAKRLTPRYVLNSLILKKTSQYTFIPIGASSPHSQI